MQIRKVHGINGVGINGAGTDKVGMVGASTVYVGTKITAQTRFLFLVVISVSVTIAIIPKCQNKDETIAYPLVKKNLGTG